LSQNPFSMPSRFLKISLWGIFLILSQNSTASISPLNPISLENYTAQDSLLDLYRESALKVNDLVNTRLDVHFDYARHYLNGKEWISLKPHFYPTDSLSLDAKGMDIHFIGLIEGNTRHKLNYEYKNDLIKIHLGKTYKNGQIYTVYIEYTAKPDEIKQKGSAAITSAKGLYFINSDGKNPDKPIQIWTQGETESSSCWFPTIDKPNQKTTEEISMTVPSKYVSLSNGRLVSQKKNLDGTRTDTWKMDLPHAPYLFMMAVGDFKIFHDHWKNKEVNYYLEPKYAPYAKQIFGNTPEMISYFSKITGIDYPWNKYAQIVVRDYVSGAMENTTATLHGESVQKTARELLDEDQETTICHELFHQWFGDYVTAESWSNITLNESFATLSEILWTGYKKGKDAEDAERYEKLHTYLSGTQNGNSPPLVRYHYKDREDVFDNVSYPKGSVILYQLKNVLGDDAFFAGLNLYLKTNAFKSAEAAQLRLALEQITGEDLNAYFNQWYYGEGHPILDIRSQYTDGYLKLTIKQIQDSNLSDFRLPIKLGIYLDGKLEVHPVILEGRNQTLSIPLRKNPDFIDYDVDKTLVGEIQDHKSAANYSFAYVHAPSFSNRLEAVQFALKDQNLTDSKLILEKALRDPSHQIREELIQGLDFSKPEIQAFAEPELLKMAKNDPRTKVRALAIEKLCETRNHIYEPLCMEGLKNPSYAIEAASLNGFISLNPDQAEKKIQSLDKETLDHMAGPIANFYAFRADDAKASFFDQIFQSGNPSKEFQVFRFYLAYLKKNTNPDITQTGVNNIVQLIQGIHQSGANEEVAAAFRGIAGAKSEEATTASDSKLKEALNKQTAIFTQAAKDLLK